MSLQDNDDASEDSDEDVELMTAESQREQHARLDKGERYRSHIVQAYFSS